MSEDCPSITDHPLELGSIDSRLTISTISVSVTFHGEINSPCGEDEGDMCQADGSGSITFNRVAIADEGGENTFKAYQYGNCGSCKLGSVSGLPFFNLQIGEIWDSGCPYFVAPSGLSIHSFIIEGRNNSGVCEARISIGVTEAPDTSYCSGLENSAWYTGTDWMPEASLIGSHNFTIVFEGIGGNPDPVFNITVVIA